MTIERRSPLWRALFLALSAFALGALVLAAACGGDDDDDDDDGDSSSPTATRTSDSTDGDDDDDGGDDDDDSGDDDPFADLEGFTGDLESVDWFVAYTVTTDGEESTWRIYSKGENSRYEFGDDEGSFISIVTPQASYTCSESAGEGFCFEGEGGVGGGNPFAGIFTAFASAEALQAYAGAFAGVEIDTSSENIAGVNASCFSASGDFDTDSGSIKWCFSDSGLLLLALYDFDSGVTEMRATEFRDNVPDDVFEPPYELTNFGQ
jgi:hypothetical protein